MAVLVEINAIECGLPARTAGCGRERIRRYLNPNDVIQAKNHEERKTSTLYRDSATAERTRRHARLLRQEDTTSWGCHTEIEHGSNEKGRIPSGQTSLARTHPETTSAAPVGAQKPARETRLRTRNHSFQRKFDTTTSQIGSVLSYFLRRMPAARSVVCGLLLVLQLLVGVSVAVSVAMTVATDKDEYQYSETIVVTWSNAPSAGTYTLAIVPAGECLADSWTCATNTVGHELWTMTSFSNMVSGTWNVDRSVFNTFNGSLDVRIFDSTNTIYASKTVKVLAWAEVTLLDTPVFFRLLHIFVNVSSPYHRTNDKVAIFPADLCDNPYTCFWQAGDAAAGTQVWWNTTFSISMNIAVGQQYRIGYLLGQSSIESGISSPLLRTGRSLVLAMTEPFVFAFGGSVTTNATYALNEPMNLIWQGEEGRGYSDCINVYPLGSTTPVETVYIGHNGITGRAAFSGISQLGTYVARFLVECKTTQEANNATFDVIPGVSLSTPQLIVNNGAQVTITITTSGFQIDGDAIGVFSAGCSTPEIVINPSLDSSCQVYASAAYNVTLGVQQDSFQFQIPAGANIRFWYLSAGVIPIVQLGPVKAYASVGACEASCENQGAACGVDSDCSNCATQANVCLAANPPVQAPASAQAPATNVQSPSGQSSGTAPQASNTNPAKPPSSSSSIVCSVLFTALAALSSSLFLFM